MSGHIRQILNSENIKIAIKPLKTLGHAFKKPKDRLTKEQLKGIVYKLSCRTCPFTYIGESKRSWKSRWAEHKPGTNGNVGSAVKQHSKTTGHDIHSDLQANRRENQGQKAFSRAVTFIPGQELKMHVFCINAIPELKEMPSNVAMVMVF